MSSVYVWRYALLVVHAIKEEEDIYMIHDTRVKLKISLVLPSSSIFFSN